MLIQQSFGRKVSLIKIVRGDQPMNAAQFQSHLKGIRLLCSAVQPNRAFFDWKWCLVIPGDGSDHKTEWSRCLFRGHGFKCHSDGGETASL
jgi:hypothetical protein